MGDERWHVSDGGKVRQVVVRHVAAAEAGGGEALGARFIMVAYVRGGQQPFVTRDAHLFRAPPTEAQIDGLKAEAAQQREQMTQRMAAAARSEADLEQGRAERARKRREENLRVLRERMDRNWTLWHPACRPSHAHPLLTPPHGFEDLT